MKMVDSYRVIDIQIYKNSKWISCYKTFDDKNVIYRIYSLIKSQFKGHKLRIIDHNGKIIDPSILEKNKIRKIFIK
jgi:hypothetical protein